MKKTFLYLLTVIMSITVLSSCLGDNDSYSSGTGTYAVVVSEEGTTYARTIIGGMSSTTIDSYKPGDVLLVNYEINHSNYKTLPSGTPVFIAEYATPTNENTEFKTEDQILVKTQSVDLDLENQPGIKSITLGGGHHSWLSKYFMDRWLFLFQAELTKDQTMSIDLFYDENQQYDEKGEALPENTYIIDVRLNITGTPNTGSEATNREQYAVANLSQLRHILSPQSVDENGALVNIRLRYFKKENNNTSSVLTLTSTVGNLDYYEE